MMLRGIFPFVALVSTGFLTACQTPPTALPPSADEATSSTTATTDKKLDDASAAFKRTEYAAAAEIWRPLAEQGNPAAEVGMGKLYDFGWGVPQDRVQATAWYQKAADQGFAEGECTIGLGYVEGGRVQPHDISLGLALMKKAVDHGSGSCAESIGELYRVGLFGVSKDPVEAAAWHRRGAEMGDTLAEGRLGIDYQFGIGVERDSVLAAYWYRKQVEQMRQDAERGDAVAQLSLGEAYAWATSGLPRDRAAALYWCGKAAQQTSRIKISAEHCVALAK
jgi:TPR repeat protein